MTPTTRFTATSTKMQVLECLMRFGPTSRKQLARRIGLTSSAITKTTAGMLEEGLIREGAPEKSHSVGRKEVRLHLRGEAGAVLGLDFSSKDAQITLLDLALRIKTHKTLRYPQLDEGCLARVLNEAEQVLQKRGRQNIRGVGILVQGYIENGESRSLPLPDIKGRAQAALALPCTLRNNVRGLAISEQFLDTPPENFVLLKYGPGIGSVLVSDGKILDGVHHRAGELGHIAWPGGGSGQPCRVCGKPVCLESACGFEAVIRAAKGAPQNGVDFAAVQKASEKDGGKALQAAMEDLAKAAAVMVQTLDPELVLLAGEIFTHKAWFARFEALLRACAGGLGGVSISPVRAYEAKRKKAAGIIAINSFLSG